MTKVTPDAADFLKALMGAHEAELPAPDSLIWNTVWAGALQTAIRRGIDDQLSEALAGRLHAAITPQALESPPNSEPSRLPRGKAETGGRKRAAAERSSLRKTGRGAVAMPASEGDQLVLHGVTVGQHGRIAKIIEVLGMDGNPPYRVRFEDGYETIMSPGPDAVVRRFSDEE